MESSGARGSPLDDGGLWMKLDSTSDEELARCCTAVEEQHPTLPTEGSTQPGTNNSSLTLSNKAADATEAEANPSSLDWHHGEKTLMATQVDEVTVNTAEESAGIEGLSRYKMSDQAAEQHAAAVEDTAGLVEERSDQRNQDPQDTARQHGGRKSPQQNQPQSEELSGSTDDVVAANPDQDDVGTNAAFRGNEELYTCSQTHRGRAAHRPADLPDDDSRSLHHNLKNNDWVRRESGSGETQLPVAEEEEAMKSEQRDGTRKIANDIQQGQQLLQRLQLVQQRQDVHMSASTLTVQQAAKATAHEEKAALGPEDGNKGTQANLLMEQSKSSEPEDQGTEAENMDQRQEDNWVCARPAQHRFSADQAFKQIPEAQREQDLQRAGGVFHLSDKPDVLEIPFHTSISPEPFPRNDGRSQQSTWRFSEQKMQKEISVEMQRELVLVNQGKIPGGYSKGAVRHLKDTKLLFEAFQQLNTEGPTRHRKSPTLTAKGHIYPSVLERTRSLEMFSLKTCPVTRAHSLRLCESGTLERDRSPESIRSKSPTLGPRDKTRLSPYPMKDTHLHTYQSVEPLSPDASTAAVETRTRTTEGNALKQNPFFKLRPALALQPEVEKDIREAREREEELRRQRCTLYGDNRQTSQEEEGSQVTETPEAGVGQQTTGKLGQVWPPPSKSSHTPSEQPQQKQRDHRAARPKAPLWQRWESGLTNGQRPQDNN